MWVQSSGQHFAVVRFGREIFVCGKVQLCIFAAWSVHIERSLNHANNNLIRFKWFGYLDDFGFTPPSALGCWCFKMTSTKPLCTESCFKVKRKRAKRVGTSSSYLAMLGNRIQVLNGRWRRLLNNKFFVSVLLAPELWSLYEIFK